MTGQRKRSRSQQIALALAVIGTVAVVAWFVWPREHVRIERVRQAGSGGHDASVEVLKVSAAVDDIAWSPDSTKLAVLTKSGAATDVRTHAVLLYDIVKARQERTVYESSDAMLSVAFWPDGARIGCATWRTGPRGECEIPMWEPSTGKKLGSLVGAPLEGLGVPFTSDPLSIAVSPNSRYLAAGTKLVDAQRLHGAHIGGEVCLWELETGELKWFDRSTHTDIVQTVVFSRDSKTLASAGIDKLIRLWDPETGELKKTLTGAAWHGIASVAFSPDGKLLASGGSGEEEGGTVRIWDVDTGLLKHVMPAFRRQSPVRVSFSPDGQTLFAVGPKKDSNTPEWRVHMWDPSTGQHKGMLLERPGDARALAVSPDGKQLAVGTFQGEIVVVGLNP